MRAPDVLVLVAYFATMIAVGFLYSRQKSADMYFAGHKQLNWWLGGISFFMSYVSALSIVVYAGLGYRYGLVALTLYWTTVPATVLTTWLFARPWRRAGVITPTEFLEERFSSGVRQVFVWSGIPLRIIDEALKIVAIGIFVSAGLNLPPFATMVAVGLTILVYSVLGGLWAVVVTVLVQFVLVSGALVLLLPLSFGAAGGWQGLSAALPARFFAPVNENYGWGFVGAFIILSFMSIAGNWSMVQKFYAARSDGQARGVGWLASVLFFLLPPLWIFTGIFARGFIPPAGLDPQTIYARVAAQLLPVGMLGLVVAALFAATMSVLSNGYNVMAAVLTVDVYQRHARPRAGERELVLVGRILTGTIALVVLLLALAVTYFRWTIFDTMVAAFGFFTPPTVLPMIGGLITRRLSARGALASFLAGIGIGLLLLLYRWFGTPADPNAFQALSIVLSTAATMAVLIVAAVWFPPTGEAAQRASDFFVALKRPCAVAEEILASPAPIAGIVIAVMGLVLAAVGLGILPGTAANILTMSMGMVFVAIGALMFASQWFGRRSASSTFPTSE